MSYPGFLRFDFGERQTCRQVFRCKICLKLKGGKICCLFVLLVLNKGNKNFLGVWKFGGSKKWRTALPSNARPWLRACWIPKHFERNATILCRYRDGCKAKF